MTLSDLELKYKGWQELREADLFNSWEQTRRIALSSLTHPAYKAPRGFDNYFPNPYSKVKKKPLVIPSEEEVNKWMDKLNSLEYKEYNGG